MPGIIINTNFDLNLNAPLDSRLVVTNSVARESILYRYEGMKVYQTLDKQTYVWTGLTWSQDKYGIYGGSGSLVGDTTVNFGTVSNSIGADSNELTFAANYANSKSRITNKFLRHTVFGAGNEFRGVEFRQQLAYTNLIGFSYDSSYIGFNSSSPNGNFGDISINTGDATVTELARFTSTGKVGIGTSNPQEVLQVNGGASQPLVIHKSGNAVIGYNWYYTNSDQVFTSSIGSSRINQSNGEIAFSNRQANAASTAFVNSLYLSPSGNVGVGNTSPTAKLDVIGTAIISATATSKYFTFTDNSSYRITGNVLYPLVIQSSTDNIFYIQSDNTSPFYKSTFDSNVRINGSSVLNNNLTVLTGNIAITGTGSITNQEAPTTLTPTSNVYYSLDGDFTGTGTHGGTYLLSGFTYSFQFSRVGNLCQIDYTIVKNSVTSYATTFHGWLLKFTDSRFKPSSYSIGAGISSYSVGTSSVPASTILPVSSQIFRNDGTSTNPSLPTSNDFFVRIRTLTGFVSNSLIGSDYTIFPMYNLAFKGTITYIASDNQQGYVPIAYPPLEVM